MSDTYKIKDQNEAIKLAKLHAQKTPSQWLFYAVIVIFPFFLGFFILLEMSRNNYVSGVPISEKSYLISKTIPFLLLLVVIEIFVSWMLGKKNYYRLNNSINSLSQGMAQTLFGQIIKSLSIFPYVYIYEKYAIVDLEETWVLWLLTFIIVEWSYYWLHRIGHEWNVPWAGHVAHHSSEDYNLSTALRQGSLQVAYDWVFSLPFAFFIPIRLYFFHKQVNTLYQFWIHTQLITRLPWIFEFFFNTPSHHRVHHGRNPQYIDKNYGGTLIIFDRIFGTFEPEEEEVVYGITHKFETWSPIFFQTHHLVESWEVFKLTSGIWSKIRVFLDRGPGYNYEVLYYQDINNPPPKVTPQNVIKYDSTVPNQIIGCYVFVYFLVAIGENLLISALPEVDWFILFMNFFALVAIAAMFDCKPWIKYGEPIRLTLLCFEYVYFKIHLNNEDFATLFSDFWFLLFTSFLFLSGIVFLKYYKVLDTKKTD